MHIDHMLEKIEAQLTEIYGEDDKRETSAKEEELASLLKHLRGIGLSVKWAESLDDIILSYQDDAGEVQYDFAFE